MFCCLLPQVAAEVRSFLHDEWGITYATLEAEVSGCGWEELLGDWFMAHMETADTELARFANAARQKK